MSNLFRVDVPANPSPSRDNVIANTKLLKDTVGWTCKNLFNPADKKVGYAITMVVGQTPPQAYIASSTNGLTYIAEIETDTDYTISRKTGVGNKFEIALFTTQPTIPNTGAETGSEMVVDGNEYDTYTFNSENHHWVAFTVNNTTGDTTTVDATAEAMLRYANILDDSYEPYHSESVKDKFDGLLDLFYPIGTIYQTLDDSFDPNIAWGGVWQTIAGAFLFSTNFSSEYPIGSRGGEYTHTLTTNEMPSHAHQYNHLDPLEAPLQLPAYDGRNATASDSNELYQWGDTTTSVGGGQAHNNMPPYVVVKTWKRVQPYIETSPFYKYDTGQVCTGWYQESTKTFSGGCYCGMLVWLLRDTNQLHWVTFCLSHSNGTAQAMTYRYGKTDSYLTWNGELWYYSTDSNVQSSYASSTELDSTNPASRRYPYEFSGSTPTDEEAIPIILKSLLSSIYSH